MSEWLMPWHKRGHSGAIADNFLWRSGPLFIMDNHRLALWCWCQRIHESDAWTFVHIDRHYDAQWLAIDPWSTQKKPPENQSLNQFREASAEITPGYVAQLNRWDTIVSALWCLHRDRLKRLIFVGTDIEGSSPQLPESEYFQAEDAHALLARLATAGGATNGPCIIDLDLDVFTRRDADGKYALAYPEDLLIRIGSEILEGLSSGAFGVVTIALSPSTTGDWSLAERLLTLVLGALPDFVDFRAKAP